MPDRAVEQNGPHIPNKLYFRIGEVARLTGLQQYVLRYWETEFPQIRPRKSGSNQRLYRRKDVTMVLTIKDLLYEKRYTIEGARQYLQNRERTQEKPVAREQGELFTAPKPTGLEQIRRELREIWEMLK